MHIAYLIPTVDRIGGAERQVLLLAGGMADHGHRVTVIALSGNGSGPAQSLSQHGVSFETLQMRKGLLDPRGWLRLHRWIQSNRPDVLHSHLPHAALLARWSRLFAPVPVLTDTIHSPHVGGLLRRMGYRLSSQLPDLVTAVSAAAAEPWLNAHLLNGHELVLIPNGVDLNYWNRPKDICGAQPCSTALGKFIWLSVGRLDPVKDHVTLLRAFAQLPTRTHLLIAGCGPLQAQLESLAHTLEIDQRVAFVGFQQDLRPLMEKSDAFVLTSRWEGLPVALMEASAFGMPAVITNTRGSQQVLSDSAAWAVAVGDANALAAAMKEVMELSPSERVEIGARAHNNIAEHFSLDAMLQGYEALYRNTLAGNPRPVRFHRARAHSSTPFHSSTTGI